MILEPAIRAELYKALSPTERAMLDVLDAGDLVPTSKANRVRAVYIRHALSVLSPSTILICARGRGYTMHKLDTNQPTNGERL